MWYIFLLNLIIIVIIIKFFNQWVQPNPTQLDPCGLNWTPVMGWVGLDFFFNPSWWVGSKNSHNPTQLNPRTTLSLAYPKIPTYSWTFVSIPNWTWSCSRCLCLAQISNLWLTPLHGSQYVTNSSNLIDYCWLRSSSLHKRWRSGNTWLQNPKAHKHSSFSMSIWVLSLCFHTWWLLK